MPKVTPEQIVAELEPIAVKAVMADKKVKLLAKVNHQDNFALHYARTVTLNYTEKAIPGILSRVQACFDADIADEKRRAQENSQAESWAIQAIRVVASFRSHSVP